MKFSFLFGWLIIMFLVSQCSHKNVFKTPSDNKPFKIRFQNMVGLELATAGCSLMNFGGIDRFCDYSNRNSANMFFQIGPGLTRVLEAEEKIDSNLLLKNRLILWNEWNRHGLHFYAVSALDLQPSVVDFLKVVRSSKVSVISANIFSSQTAELLFEPYYLFYLEKEPFIFIAFSEEKRVSLKDKSWFVEDASESFKKLLKKLPSNVSVYHIVGSLSESTRKKLVEVSNKPIIFIGGELAEKNTVSIVPFYKNSYWIKAPDLGRGVGEIEIYLSKPLEKNLIRINKLFYKYTSIVLHKKASDQSCLNLLQEDKKNSCKNFP